MNLKIEITDLTICRAFFAGWVFIYHVDLYVRFSDWLGPFKSLVRHGYLGVDGFFILSGLILAQVHNEFASNATLSDRMRVEVRPLKLKELLIFWGKRLARIYPVHLVTLLLFGAIFVVGVAHGLTPRDPARFAADSFLENMFLIHGWGFTSQGAWNYPSWSVSTEWAGYLAFPVLWFIVTYFEWYVALQLGIIIFVAMGLIVTRYHNLNLAFGVGLIRFVPEFLLGMSTTRIMPHFADYAWLRQTAFYAGFGSTVVFATLGFDWLVVIGVWLFLFACAMQADAHCPPFIHAPLLRRLGLLSYAFYMSFALAELLLSQGFRRIGWQPAEHGLAFTGGMVVITFATAILLHLVVEVPCRRRADRWLARFAET